MAPQASLQTFKNLVGIKFQLYNSLFTSLPFHKIERTGILVSLLLLNCEDGFKKKKSPLEIIDEFFAQQTSLQKEEEKIDLLFRLVQYVERQVVLFDALEDAAFKEVNDMGGRGTLKQLAMDVELANAEDLLLKKLKDFSIQLVLTAHPTQFYRGAVLGIIHDLSSAIVGNNENQIYTYLQQLGRTPFFQHEKPTPYDEAVSLIWYLENVFYAAAGKISSFIKNRFPETIHVQHPLIKMGFWPGGDRDGNPFVNAATTLQVADALRGSIIKCYYLDIRKLKRRLTFKGVDVALTALEKQLYEHLFIPGNQFCLTRHAILDTLQKIRQQLIYDHNGLFVSLVENLINKVELFGLYFATLDVRQDSSIHDKLYNSLAAQNIIHENYQSLSVPEKMALLTNFVECTETIKFEDDVQKDVMEAIQAIASIQKLSGEAGCNRYIISQCSSALNVMEVYGLFLLNGWKKDKLSVDIVPLFEMIDDLQNAATVMKSLYENESYRQHLQRRGNKQTIMLGFSDGTKDGGYLMANWSIYKAKESLTAISKEYGVEVIFFDGRGGPPARGGGKTHQFYASMGKNISHKEIQLTIQGQTVSSNFGTVDAAQFNIEQLLNAGLINDVLKNDQQTFTAAQEKLLGELAAIGYHAYQSLKNDPYFLDYLAHVSPLRFYAETNIGSRPSKRGKGKKIEFKDLRAIPFVGAWSQIKQNVTGYYGVGTALQELDKQKKFNELKELYTHSLFFKTLIDNCEMAMQKCFFPLTAGLSAHPQFGNIWNKLFSEFELTKHYLNRLTGHTDLMADFPVEQLSIQMRERIVLPLITIQQYALSKMRMADEKLIESPHKKPYEKLVMRCSFGIINAARNSA
ncbi:MAG: phosphoenolpyruvate carboxylase [Sphingobacteriia bacterium]|nr:phosphoenolpyruvate carboxylase [Sphingobacteriia bacterium]